MSNQATGGATPPQTPEALTADIEQTRRHLGETVEALVAKTDVKARAQHRAAEATANLRGKAGSAAGKARDGVRGATQKAREAKDKAAARAPSAIQSADGRIYGAVAIALTAALIGAWLIVRGQRR